jgi:hypothetical protein
MLDTSTICPQSCGRMSQTEHRRTRGANVTRDTRLGSPPDLDAARAINEAVAAIERTFVGGADWRSVVASLHLMRRILEEPARMCRRCGRAWMLEYGVAFALHRRGLPLPKYCADCRAVRRQERTGR